MGKTKNRKLTPRQRRLWELEKFLLRFVVLAIPLYLILTFGINMSPAQAEVARESSALLGTMGFNATLYGTGIAVSFPDKAPFFFTISADCTGWKAMLFLAALVVAVPRRSWKARAVGIVAGAAVLWVVNIFRVAAVVSAYSSYGYATAMIVHDYLWQVGLGAVALLFWVLWLRLTKP